MVIFQEFRSTMNVLITGSDGFIGCHLAADLAARGHQVCGLDSGGVAMPAWLRLERENYSKLKSVRCDIRNREELARVVGALSPDVIVHLAAKPGVAGAEVDPLAYEEVNVGGVANLIAACSLAGVRRIVHASTSSVYGNVVGAINETTPLRPLGHYGRTKLNGEKLLQDAATLGGMDVIILRPFNVIGRMGRPDMAPWRFAEQIIHGSTLSIHEGASRDFTSVNDVTVAFALSVESRITGCQIMNVGAGEPHSAVQLADGLAGAIGLGYDAEMVPLPTYMPKTTHAEVGRAKTLLGWEPQVRFADAVAEFGRWLKNRLSAA